MPQALMIVGAILVLLGVAGIAAGAPDWVLGLSLGAALIQSGAIALVGGLVLIGLAQVLNAVQSLLDRLDAIASAPAARRPAIEQKKWTTTPETAAPVSRVPVDEAPLAGQEAADFQDEAVPRGRRDSSSGYRIEESGRTRRERNAEQAESGRSRFASDDHMRVRREDPAAFGDETSRRPRHDGGSSHGAESPGDDQSHSRAASPSARREDVARSRRGGLLPLPPPPLPVPPGSRPRSRDVIPESPALRFRPVEAKPSDQAPLETTVVRSGVIGGMAYTLYADGSIEAELPIGTVRFGSIADLQDHVTRTGTEADVDFKESSR